MSRPRRVSSVGRRHGRGAERADRSTLDRVLDLGPRAKPLWWYPALSLLVGLVLGLVLGRFDGDDWGALGFLIYEGDPESARSFVSLAATSVVTITSLTLTITVVTLQLASSQYSPRLIEHYLNDRGIRAVISLFLLTFAFAVATLLSTRLPDGGADGQVPGPAISLLVVLVVASLGALVFFVYRVTRTIRVEAILQLVRDRTIESIDRRNERDPEGEPEDELPEPDGDVTVLSEQTGFFVDLDRSAIDRAGLDGSVRVWILVAPGDFVLAGTPVAEVSGWSADADEVTDEVRSWLRFDTERWIEADYSYGVRSLTDVAVRALSPGINDPTTAVMAIQRIAEVMAVAARTHPDRRMTVDSGAKVFVTIRSWERTLDEVLHQIALYGRDDTTVVTEVLTMLWSMLWVDSPVDRAPAISNAVDTFGELVDVDRPEPDRRVVQRHLDALRASIDAEEPDSAFRQLASE